MSYNIDSIDVVTSEGFFISQDRLIALADEIDEDRPEDNIFDDLDGDEPFLYPKRIAWCGEGSGYYVDALIEKVLPAFEGTADLVVCFEGGDSYLGLRVRDHKVTRHKVVMTLGEQE